MVGLIVDDVAPLGSSRLITVTGISINQPAFCFYTWLQHQPTQPTWGSALTRHFLTSFCCYIIHICLSPRSTLALIFHVHRSNEMASILRQIVAGPRARHPEANLDLCYVTDNIIATYVHAFKPPLLLSLPLKSTL